MTSLTSGCKTQLHKLIQQKNDQILALQNSINDFTREQQNRQFTQKLLSNLDADLKQLQDKLDFLEQYSLKRCSSVPVDYRGIPSGSLVTSSQGAFCCNESFCQEHNITSKNDFTLEQRNNSQLNQGYHDNDVNQDARQSKSVLNEHSSLLLSAAYDHFVHELQLERERRQYWNRFSEEVLFFVFYEQPSTQLQYEAACELQVRHWRLHEKFCMWFRRVDIPSYISTEKEICDAEYWSYCPTELLDLARESKLILNNPKWEIQQVSYFIFEYKYMVVL
eukprot:TRINITY_DN34023_c0_g1_i7.p2 TRINITY_DN34023_c0_g1~~TRINITY_DN34023_c0_g1_i7.p2  ORF type:complete len:278 (-),score=4.94 TRINITY_DN34023_c0_g1_i7:280-1113(-)